MRKLEVCLLNYKVREQMSSEYGKEFNDEIEMTDFESAFLVVYWINTSG